MSPCFLDGGEATLLCYRKVGQRSWYAIVKLALACHTDYFSSIRHTCHMQPIEHNLRVTICASIRCTVSCLLQVHTNTHTHWRAYFLHLKSLAGAR